MSNSSLTSQTKKVADIPFSVQQKILEAIKSIKFGTITIVVQDSQVIQIDKSEKIRLK